jgi:hypothetical protein
MSAETPAAEAETTTPGGDPDAPTVDGFPLREDGSFDAGAAPDELIAEWITNEKATVEDLVAAAAGDPALAARVLEGEKVATEGEPRKTAVTKLEAIIEPPTTDDDKRYGLILTLEGAPATAHFIPGVPGYFRPDSPTPVGGDGELTLDYAQTLHEGTEPLKLVEIAKSKVAAAVETAKQDLAEGRDAVAETRATKPTGEEAARVAAEQDALKGA